MDDKKDMKMRAAIGGIIVALIIIGGILMAKAGVFTALRTPDLVEFTRHFQPENMTDAKVWVNPQQVLYVYSRKSNEEEWTVICLTGSSGNTSNFMEVNEPLETVVKSLKIK